MTASMSKNKLTISAPFDEPVIILTREFDAPRELVFAVFTRAEHVRRWWGPRWIELSECEIDFRPGGAQRYVFAKAGGPKQIFRGVYQEIDTPRRFVYSLVYDVPEFRDYPATVTVSFEEVDGRTKLTETIRHQTFELRDEHLNSMGTRAAETYDRLEELLETMPRELKITRVFNAPRELVFKAWTERERVRQWWGPKGFTCPVCEIDVRPGGAIKIDMQGPDGTIYPMGGEYKEIVPPERLVFTSWAPNQRGARMFEMLNTLTFTDLGGKTELKVDVRAVMVTGDAAYPLQGMTQGWTEMIERLKADIEG